MQIWFPLSFFDASPVLPLYSSYFSESDFIIPKQQTPSGKAFVIHQEHVDIGITDGPRHENTLVTINSRWEDDLSNGFLERKKTQLNANPEPIHIIDKLDVPYKLKCLINKSSVFLTSLPPKIWRPKLTSKHKTPYYANDIDDGIFYCADFGNCVFLSDLSWEDSKLNYLIEFFNYCVTAELEKNLNIGNNVDDPTRDNIIQMIEKCWDRFCKEVACRTILGYEISILYFF